MPQQLELKLKDRTAGLLMGEQPRRDYLKALGASNGNSCSIFPLRKQVPNQQLSLSAFIASSKEIHKTIHQMKQFYLCEIEIPFPVTAKLNSDSNLLHRGNSHWLWIVATWKTLSNRQAGLFSLSFFLFFFPTQLCGMWLPVALVFICQWSSNISVFVQPLLQRVIHPHKPSVEGKQTADVISRALHGDHLKFKSEWLESTVLAFISCWYTDSCMLCYKK